MATDTAVVVRLDAVRVVWELDEGPQPCHACGLCEGYECGRRDETATCVHCGADQPEGEYWACWAEAEVSYPCGRDGERRIARFRSGGLYGIESPDAAYKREVAAGEVEELRAHLAVFGVAWREGLAGDLAFLAEAARKTGGKVGGANAD